ncbi:MAG: hypothetical protein HY289_11165 [Planctomycetes bacterium]|nr:hypothetical protein [Planctomycetota bacterium]
MHEVLQIFRRTVLCFLSGAVIVIGFFYFADGMICLRSGNREAVWVEVEEMLSKNSTLLILAIATPAFAYGLGMVNVAGAGVFFDWWARPTHDLIIIGQIESLKRPQLLKETQDLLEIRRALVELTLPLICLGIGLIVDDCSFPRFKGSPVVAGILLVAFGMSSMFLLATRLNRQFESTVKILMEEEASKPKTAEL